MEWENSMKQQSMSSVVFLEMVGMKFAQREGNKPTTVRQVSSPNVDLSLFMKEWNCCAVSSLI
jgi:hypothetical protein